MLKETVLLHVYSTNIMLKCGVGRSYNLKLLHRAELLTELQARYDLKLDKY